MKTLIITTVALAALAGAAQASQGVTDRAYVEAARCRGLAASNGLGKVDTAQIDTFLREQGGARELGVRTQAVNKMKGAEAEGDKADGEKKVKLLAEREKVCGGYLAGGK